MRPRKSIPFLVFWYSSLYLLRVKKRRRHCAFYADDGGFNATDALDQPADELYFLGVIDILTPYNYVKKVEHAWKALGNDKVSVFVLGVFARNGWDSHYRL